MVRAYAPEKGRKLETDKSYKAPQKVVSCVGLDHIILSGDFNARIGKTNAGEIIINENERRLRDLTVSSKLKIKNLSLHLRIFTSLPSREEEASHLLII